MKNEREIDTSPEPSGLLKAAKAEKPKPTSHTASAYVEVIEELRESKGFTLGEVERWFREHGCEYSASVLQSAHFKWKNNGSK